MAPAMSSPRRRASALATTAVALLALACCRSALQGFVGVPSAATGRAASPQVARRVNIFEGIEFPSLGEPDQNPEESGTRSARVVDESTSRLVEVNMPLGLGFEERDGGDIYITSVDPSSDAYAQGVRAGAQLVMVSATFGDEMWNARKVGMTQFMTVVQSRFGATMRLALEKEDSNILSAFMEAAFPPPKTEEQKKKEANLMSEFEAEEAKLADKNFWNPFR